MHTGVLTAVTAVGVAACLALAGCGGDKSQPEAKIPDETGSASASPSPTASTPTFKLPPDVKVTIDADLTGDPVKDAILQDNKYLILGLLQAMANDGPKDPAFQQYVQGRSAAGHIKELERFKAPGLTITGPVHYYRRKVDIKDAAHASVSYCEDQRKAYGKEIKSGKVLVTKPSDRSFVAYNTTVEKGADGVWRETFYLWTKGAKECLLD